MPREIREFPPIRQDNQPDEQDSGRVQYVDDLWSSQDSALHERDRQVEENVRMLVGKQWSVWHPRTHRFVDINEHLSKAGKRFAQRPVVNRLFYTYVLNHARMTENPPVIGFQPANSDKTSIDLAATMDILSKSLWDELGMVDVFNNMFAWEYTGGRAYIKLRVDPSKGDVDEYFGPAALVDPTTGEERPLIDPETGQLADVPFAPDEQGQMRPQVSMNPETGEVEITGEAWKEHEGGLAMDVLGPLECRGEWGHGTPWHRKSWHCHETFLTPQQVEELWGVKLEADAGIDTQSVGEMERMLRGSGFFGSADTQRGGAEIFGHPHGAPEGLLRIRELWVRPGAHNTPARTDDDPGGRLLIVAVEQGEVLFDDTRPAPFPYTSPIHAFDFMVTPGRPHGTSPLEFLNPLQRLYNRVWAQILEHNNLVTNPIAIVDSTSGIRDGQITNEPGQVLKVTRRPGVPALEYTSPPRLSEDPYRILTLLAREIEDLGNIAGATGRIPQPDDNSGALIRELRFNSDRYLGAPLRQAAEESGRLWESVIASLSVLWDQEKIIHWVGQDNVLRTLTVTPEMFEGQVHVKPDLESMLPESRFERQERMERLFTMGLFGNPEDPAAKRKFAQNANFPHLDAAFMTGGQNSETARFIMGRLAQGDQADQWDLFPWYDYQVWIEEFAHFMTGREWLEFDQEVRNEFVIFYEKLTQARQAQLLDIAAEQAGAQTRAQVTQLEAAQQSGLPELQAVAGEQPIGTDGQPIRGPGGPGGAVGPVTAGQGPPPEFQ